MCACARMCVRAIVHVCRQGRRSVLKSGRGPLEGNVKLPLAGGRCWGCGSVVSPPTGSEPSTSSTNNRGNDRRKRVEKRAIADRKRVLRFLGKKVGGAQLVIRRPRTWPSSLIRREAGQHGQVASDVISDKSRSF